MNENSGVKQTWRLGAWRLPAGSITQRRAFVIPYSAACIFRETGFLRYSFGRFAAAIGIRVTGSGPRHLDEIA
jgi:hypothetical protein